MATPHTDVGAAASAALDLRAVVRVLAISDSHIELESVSPGAAGACTRCEEGHGCGQSLLLKLGQPGSGRLRLGRDQLLVAESCEQALAKGALYRLEISSSSLLKMTLLLYGLPLCGLLAGTGVAVAVSGGQDLVAAGGGLLGLLLGAGWVKKLSPLSYCDVRLHPQI